MKTTYTIEDFATIISSISIQMNIQDFKEITPKQKKEPSGFKKYGQVVKPLIELDDFSDLNIILYLSVSKKSTMGLGGIIEENMYKIKAHLNIENSLEKTNLKWMLDETVEYNGVKNFLNSNSPKDIKLLNDFIKKIKKEVRIFP